MARPVAFTRAVPAARGRQAPAPAVATNVPKKVAVTPRKRVLFGWEVVTDAHFGTAFHQVEVDPHNKALTMQPTTYNWIKNDAAAVQSLADTKAEAVRQMKVTMWEGSRLAPKADPARKPPVAAPGIKLLCHELGLLVQDLARLDSSNPTAVSDAAGRYGRLRDQMADLRLAFTEAEGSFELAQALLIEKMGIE